MEASPARGRARSRRRISLALLAVVFGTATILYTYFWTAGTLAQAQDPRPDPPVELGYTDHWDGSSRTIVIDSVRANSPAETADMRPGDRVVAVNGQAVEDKNATYRVWMRGRPGETVQLDVQRSGEQKPVRLTAVFRKRLNIRDPGSPATERIGSLLRYSVPLVSVAVALVILFLRFESREVWLVALVFAGLNSARSFPEFSAVPEVFRVPAEVYQSVLLSFLGAAFYFLFAVFPSRSPIDRRLPWLKWVGLALALIFAGEMNTPDIHRPLASISRLVGPAAADKVSFTCVLSLLSLGLVSLAVNYLYSAGKESRRKIRVMVWGTVAGMGPPLVSAAAQNYAGYQPPYWLTTTLDFALLLVPVSFAYAVFKDRVLDIPVLLKRSARYLMVQRGFVFILAIACMGIVVLFAVWFERLLEPQALGTAVGAVVGTTMLWGGSQVHRRVGSRIDRAFFRSAYDARTILEDLAAKTRSTIERGELAALLDEHLRRALQPSTLTIYLRENGDLLQLMAGDMPITAPKLVVSAADLAPLAPDYIVEVLGRDGLLLGLIVLGPRLSEEPYSGEDKRLLASVAGQAGMALENIRLAEDIATRMEGERRIAREMEIAAEVQMRLLPERPPALQTLEIAAKCIQARAVGGDYYDFLDVGADMTGFVLADVSGKGVHAALLMANLQAHLRSQSSVATLPGFDPVRALSEVNRSLCRATNAQHFATVFLGVYDDRTRLLSYANCGHNPPILMRNDGRIERLEATAMVIGVLERWDCYFREVQLAPEDLIVVFSDGVTEAMREVKGDYEEFGERRLCDELMRVKAKSAAEIVEAVLGAVQQFSAGEQSDDLTLLVGRVR